MWAAFGPRGPQTMNTLPNLGDGDVTDALLNAYHYGHSAFYYANLDHFVPEDVDGEEAAENGVLREIESVRVTITESAPNRRLWSSLDAWYEQHRTAGEYERFKREAAVAEDFDMMFIAGAFDALEGRDPRGQDVLPPGVDR